MGKRKIFRKYRSKIIREVEYSKRERLWKRRVARKVYSKNVI